jgi:uncharacterized membrane protein YoaT (DUF817 family)
MQSRDTHDAAGSEVVVVGGVHAAVVAMASLSVVAAAITVTTIQHIQRPLYSARVIWMFVILGLTVEVVKHKIKNWRET